MPTARSSLMRRRKSSVAMGGLTQVKPGNYGISSNPSPRALTFAPNVTPGTYVEADDDLSVDASPPSPTTALFPPTAPPPNAPTRRRLPPGKRLSQGYIPRPPNAFMLFRANFVRQKHVPGTIETNHGSLSKIIGNCWRALPLEEKRFWEIEAKKAKAAHKERYPNYRFRPVHNKNKKKAEAASASDAAKRKEKLPTPPAEEERCEAVAQLLLEGKKGEELAEAVRQLDMAARAMSRPESAASGALSTHTPFAQPHPLPAYMQRRSSSVPPPSSFFHPSHPIALPSVPFFAAPAPQMAFPNGLFHEPGFGMGSASAHGSRAPSPVGNIARTRTLLGMRRASSCQPVPSERMWDGYDVYSVQSQQMHASALAQMGWPLQQDSEPLPEVTDASIFQPGWTSEFKDASGYAPAPGDCGPFDPHAVPPSYSPHDSAPPAGAPLSLNIGPLDSFDFSASTPSTSADGYSAITPGMYDPIDPHAPWPIAESGPPSTFDGSPAHSDASLPPHSVASSQASGICAPQPQHPQMQFDAWVTEQQGGSPQGTEQHSAMDASHLDTDQRFSALAADFDKGYNGSYGVYDGADVDMTMGLDSGMHMSGVEYGFCASQEF
ncbi:hypothetical protein PYCCODRAFT_1423556 [Trametes coccinea BRFM310]|uniref:HMG box domain-containing protein n=1 Tax=Trametes coccinea (strain BRFM310) TaxID=1353009 RepID=A0A1Y2IV73_TRAC3|nr:hypothetical protein PYCCODRAFT_1423556 [Trametes coccinea BRFM310]